MAERLEYDEFVIDDLKKIYGSYLNEFLRSILIPNSRLYIRVNTIKTSVEKVLKELNFLQMDEDFEEALYIRLKGPNKVVEHDTKVIVDKKTAESVMMGANVYKPGVKKIVGHGKEVSVISENGVIVAEGEIVNQGNLIVKVTNPLYYAPPLADLDLVKEGYVILQGKASMYVAHLLDPKPNEIIIDMTAFPGGKLTHIYQLEPKSKVIGFDHTKKKVEELREKVRKMHMNIEVYLADSRYLYEDYGIRDVDKVIIDPPCSALGIRPKVYDKKTKEDILNFYYYQKQFINSAYKILKKGGTLVYSTCTVTSWENEKVIEDERFEIEEIVRFHPHVHDLTGFFIAKLVKKK
ncbi:RsmB/NOP family class I SAM-dependent RNA methyltransferase [Sulfurisphaera javensis]|uniref:tRNA (cytosine(72)-C(5))-methyltransferase n=1 Tax=Sulfurisphaera javensis TaxID=2049879 RepID=A0AAT9GU59_9CREN